MDAGAQLGDLWMEGHFGVGDPADPGRNADAGWNRALICPPSHFEFLVEEPSMEAFLDAWLPRFLPQRCSFETYPYPGKDALFAKARESAQGFTRTGCRPITGSWVVVDCDGDECEELKSRLERILRERRASFQTGLQAARTGRS